MNGMQGARIDLNMEQKIIQGKGKRCNFVGYSPRKFRHTFQEGLRRVLKKYRDETGRSLTSCFSLGSGASDNCHEIWETPYIEDFPDAVAWVGFDHPFAREFFEQFVGEGRFKSVWGGPMHEAFEQAGLRDPDGWYTVYAVQPFVMLVDKRKLGVRNAPTKWSDLLDPQLQGRVILVGADNPEEDVPLLYFYKEYGVEGLARLAANVRGIWRPRQIAPAIVSSDQHGAAVYVLSWSHARSYPETNRISVIWPEDGALVNPLCLLVKSEKAKEMAPITGFLTGREFGGKCARHSFPSLNPDVDNGLPEGAAFQWLGWDYIKSRDTMELRERIYKLFIVTKREAQRKQRS